MMSGPGAPRNLRSPSEVQRRQTLFDQQMEEAHAEQKEEAPNSNVDPHLTQLIEFTKTVSERVKESKRKTRYKGLYVTPKKSGAGAGKAKRKSSKIKIKNAGFNTDRDRPKSVRLDEAEGDEAGRGGKRIGMIKKPKSRGLEGRYSDVKQLTKK